MTIVRDVDTQAFRSALSSFYDDMKETIGAEYVDALFAAIA